MVRSEMPHDDRPKGDSSSTTSVMLEEFKNENGRSTS